MLRCPYYEVEGGLCTIWRYRESVCSTFFCKYMGAADGQSFWRALLDYLRVVEQMLSLHAVRTVAPHLDRPVERHDRLTIEELEDRPPSPESYASLWSDWEGREADFYVACHDCIASLGEAEIGRILAATL
jgi:Fe-S-cluster containining protein